MEHASSDRKPIEQRIGEVLSAGRLTGASLNTVIALGVVSIRQPLAEAIFWLKYSNHAKSYKASLREVEKLAKLLNEKLNWRHSRRRLAAMSKEVLDYWLSDTCPVCEGRGWEKPIGAPYLSDNACVGCLARPLGRVGKRPYPWLLNAPRIRVRDKDRDDRRRQLRKRRARIDAYLESHKALLCELEELERQIGGRVIEAMSRDVKGLRRAVQDAEEEASRAPVCR